VTDPGEPPEPSTLPSDARPSREFAKVRRILLVEDDEVSANSLKTILTRLGWTVTSVGTLGAALIALADPFDTVILDLMLPDGDGTLVLKTIREMKKSARVIVTTGTGDPAILERVRALNPFLVIQKPIRLAKLLEGLQP
jgi:DNA-binding response OmpR family regulator